MEFNALNQDYEIKQKPNLPYELNALEPHISEKTLDFHFNKHHKGYQEKLEKLCKENEEYKDLKLEETIKKSHERKNKTEDLVVIKPTGAEKKDIDTEVFNNAAQVWNHNFFWLSMKPDGGGKPSKELLKLVEDEFGSFDDFKEKFIEAGKTQFGSGYVWLVYNKKSKKIELLKAHDAECPIVDSDLYPLITCDVWEHAYYLDYQNQREAFLKVFIDKLVNWEFAERRLEAVLS